MLQQDPSFEAYAFPPSSSLEVLTRTHFNHGVFPGTFSEPVVISHEKATPPSGAPSLGTTKITLVAAFHGSTAPRPVEVRTFAIVVSADSTDIDFDISHEHPSPVSVDTRSPLSMVHRLSVTSSNSGRARIAARTHRLGRGTGDQIVLCEVDEVGHLSTPISLSYGGSMGTSGYLFDGFRGRLIVPHPSFLNIVDYV
ncbi:hypothetical protein L218DRAFT_116778 [Marasmius fiardii PR-910]|nr:hypothetical protein L218DRAFT_116778 [Marasmius fiardii PR-910]